VIWDVRVTCEGPFEPGWPGVHLLSGREVPRGLKCLSEIAAGAEHVGPPRCQVICVDPLIPHRPDPAIGSSPIPDCPSRTPDLDTAFACRGQAPAADVGKPGQHLLVLRTAKTQYRPCLRKNQPQTSDATVLQLPEPIGDRVDSEIGGGPHVGKAEFERSYELEGRVLPVERWGNRDCSLGKPARATT